MFAVMKFRKGILYFLFVLYGWPVIMAQCSGTIVGFFPATVNGITVTQTYTGDVGVASYYTICNVTAGQTSLGGGTTNSFIQKLTFSIPVNNIVYIINAADSSAPWGNTESFSFSVDAGVLTATQAGTLCLFRQVNNTFIANTYGPPGNAAYFTLSSSAPYNSITVSGPGGNNGSFMALCSSSIGVESFSNKEQLTVYPNPSTDGRFTVDFSLTGEAVMEIYDISGILVGKYNLKPQEHRLEISSDKFSDGVYIYKITGNNSVLNSGKIVVIK